MPVSSEGNRISLNDELSRDDCFRFLAAMHSTVEAKGYQDLHLDFSDCTKAFAPEMLTICARCLAYWKEGVDVNLILPTDQRMSRLFRNTNWAHFIDFREFELSRFRGYTHSPAIRFSDGREQHSAVNKTLDVLLAAISHFGRDEIRYIEWAVNEITDNVINHADSPVGGLIQVTNKRQREQVEITVSDSGLGIPATLRETHTELMSDTEALDAAIREGVTRDKSFGQGNGLYGTWRISQKSGGDFEICSRYANLTSSERNGLKINSRQIPYRGTLVVTRIGYSDKFDLSDALLFSGKPHIPTDYIETHFEEDENGNILFAIRNESDGFGSRSVGEPVRRKLRNVIGCLESGSVIVDFSDVHLVSSSYADEVIGKLFVELGPIEFMAKVKLTNIDPLVRDLVDRAVTQRMKS